MKSFGRLLRRLRGKTPLLTIARRSQLAADYLGNVEAGQVPIDETMARHILRHGFDLHRQDTNRLILGLKLYDLGLKENDLRQLVIGLIRKELPPAARTELKQWYRRYAAG
jgi:hypothetical protein